MCSGSINDILAVKVSVLALPQHMTMLMCLVLAEQICYAAAAAAVAEQVGLPRLATANTSTDMPL